MHDTSVEDRLRLAFRGETDGLGLTITAAELERRLAARRGSRNGRRLSLLAAGIAIVAVGTIGALSNGWLRLPAIGITGGPLPSPTPSASVAPSSSPATSAAAFSPVMRVSVSTLGKLGATVSLRTGCWRPYAMTDAITGEGDCAEPSLVPLCCETLDVPYGSDLTFTVPGGWSIERSEIGIAGKGWVDDRVAASRSITGWRSTGDQAMRFDAVLSRDGENFSTSFGVSIHGAVDVPTVAPPSTACGAPDLTVPTPPAVRLIVDGVPSVAGTTATTHWGTASHQVDADPMPRAAIEIPAGSTLALWIAGNVCATDWRIEYGPPVTGPWTSIDRVGSLVLVHQTPPDGPVNGHANRFDLATLPPGEWYIEASLGYADGDAEVGWHVIVK